MRKVGSVIVYVKTRTGKKQVLYASSYKMKVQKAVKASGAGAQNA